MTKKELATQIAKHHKEIKPEINIDRYVKVLIKGMTTSELMKAVEGLNK